METKLSEMMSELVNRIQLMERHKNIQEKFIWNLFHDFCN